MYLNSINYFRGVSIVFIVFGHCLSIADFSYESIAGLTLLNLTTQLSDFKFWVKELGK